MRENRKLCFEPCPLALTRRNRDESVGVSVNEISSETRIATAVVMPKL